jgi:hypothetical protein
MDKKKLLEDILSGEVETVVILKEDYVELKRDSEFLEFLEAHGVDNWEGYDDARAAYHELHGGDLD